MSGPLLLRRLAGVATVATIAYTYHEFDRIARVRTHPMPKADFAKLSLGANLMKWGDLKKPTVSVVEVTAEPQKILQLTELAFERGTTLEPEMQGWTEFLTGEAYHAYQHFTRAHPVPAMFQSLFADTTSYLPLRGLLSLFPLFGGEVPSVPKLTDNLVDDYGIGALSPSEEYAHDQAIVEFRTSRMKSNAPLSGPIALGNVFVTASNCGIVSNERYVVRYALMNTTDLHALDGRVMWVLAYDKTACTTMFFAVGAGQHSLPFLDRMNNHTAGLVFSVMHHSFAKMLKVAEKSGGMKRLTDGVSEFALSKEQLLAEGDKDLGRRRGMAGAFDGFSRMVALMRQMGGMDVVDVPPSPETGDQDGLALVAPKDL